MSVVDENIVFSAESELSGKTDGKFALFLPMAVKNATIYLMKTISNNVIYKTNSMADAAKYVLDRLSRIDKSNLDVMHTVIVPDRASLEAERAILNELGGSFNVQVKTFRRLAADVLPKYEYLSKQAGILALSGIIQDNKDKLVCYKRGVETPGFVESVYDAVCTFKYCNIKPEMLHREMPPSVSGKAHDLALLYKAYLEFTENRFIDSADKLEKLCEAIRDTDFAAKSYFYLFDFDNLSKQELAICEQLIYKSLGVTVACCVSERDEDKRLYLNDIYHGVLKLFSSDEAKRRQVQFEIINGTSYAHGFAKQIGDNLFRYSDVAPLEAGKFLEIYEGESRVDEVYALACRIQKYIRSNPKHRFRDIYVVASDVAMYSNAISTVFAEFDIPYFCDRQYALSDHPYARYIVDYLTLCRNNGKLSSVLPFVKNFLFCGNFDGAEQDDSVYLFENYCLKYNVSYRYDGFALGRHEDYFDKADSFRRQFNSLFSTLKAPNHATIKEYTDFVRSLIEIVGLNEKNSRFASMQQQAGLEFESKVTEQVVEKFDGVLTQMQKVLGERYVGLDEFVKLLVSGVAAVKISVIPVYNDCVIFANMAKARKHDVGFLALLGANQGAMPIVKSDAKLLSDRNIEELQSVQIDIEPKIIVENRRERFSLFQLLLEPTEKLYVSYTTSDGIDRLIPSGFVRELGKLFVKNGKPYFDGENNLCKSNELLQDDVYTEKQAFARLVLNSRKIRDSQDVKMPSYQALKTYFGDKLAQYETAKEGLNIYVPRGSELYLKNSATSVSQLTDFFKCPYRFYIQYGLNVKPRTVAELKSSDLGNVLHAVLENYVREMDVNESDDVTEQKAREKFDVAMNDDFYRGLKNDVKMVGILSQLKSESVRMCKVVKNQIQNSEFQNYATELSFGGNSELPPVVVDFDGGKFHLVGKIDRVDICDGRFIVIDYKSGANAAHYGEKELYVGHKLQLPVYVRAVENVTGLRPAGFYYFNMHDTFADLDAKDDYVYNGRTLNDVDVACQIDRQLQKGRSTKLGLSLKADGTFNMLGGRTKLLESEQFDAQVEYAFDLIRSAGNMMKNGYAAVNPYEGACSYCDYKDVCDFGDCFHYNARKVDDDVDKNVIDRTVENERN